MDAQNNNEEYEQELDQAVLNTMILSLQPKSITYVKKNIGKNKTRKNKSKKTLVRQIVITVIEDDDEKQ